MPIRRYREIWVADYEFRAEPGARPVPQCLVAHELISGRSIRVWGDDLNTPCPPYATGPDVLFVAYYAPAEMSCHLALGWELPANVLDLYSEFRVATNGRTLPHGSGLLGALAHHGLDGITSMEKAEMRELVLRGGPYTVEERQDILEYCESDVIATSKLYFAMAARFEEPDELGRALLRGRYSKAVAKMEDNGVPIDMELLTHLQRNWEPLRDRLVQKVDSAYGVYEGRTFKLAKFEAYLKANSIPWPRTPMGRLATDDETFREQCKTYPGLQPLKELRNSLGQLRLSDLAVGRDGRNRTMLSMLRSKTGRNQPSTSRFIFGLSSWLRGLIKPPPGHGLIYLDWKQQEFGIAAALSGDRAMLEAYHTGDPYLAFAKQAGAVPACATRDSHPKEREQFKAATLAVQYGMGEESLARRIQQPTPYARQLLQLHRRTYRRFWEWSDGTVEYALAHKTLWTVFGWRISIEGAANDHSLRNWLMQSNGAEVLRIACSLATEHGIRVIAPVHDALLVEAPLEQLDSVAATMQSLMSEASRAVLGGFELQADAKVFRAPDRYADEKGAAMWKVVNELLVELQAPEGAS